MMNENDYKHATAVVRAVIHEWDPYCLLAEGAPQDEFDSEVAELVARIKFISTPEDASRILSEVFAKAFEPENFSIESCSVIGEILYNRLKTENLVKS